MRLLNTSSLQLQLFVDERKLPEFAILSHRWLEVEALFNDVETLGEMTPQRLLEQCDSGVRGEKSSSWSKICQACIVASEHGYEYIWIDTCCIDKSSSSELSEAINSMYRWYRTATICYVYIQDVSVTWSDRDDEGALEVFREQFTNSAWFERGWTLQELLAPKTIEFYNITWERLGGWSAYRSSYLPSISWSAAHDRDPTERMLNFVAARTKIPKDILTHQMPLADISVGARLSWAADRTTTRVEDEAYSLLGIFGINMPLLYGEGKNAFARLQREIMSHITDQTILAWSSTADEAKLLARDSKQNCPILAPSVANFAACGPLMALRNTSAEGSHLLLKHGLRVSVELVVGMGNWGCGHVYEIRPLNGINVLEISSDARSENDMHTIKHADQKVSPSFPPGDFAQTAFAVLDCFRSEQPLLYPAIRLRVISLERREFTLSAIRQLVFLRPNSSRSMWLQCIGNPQHHAVTTGLFNNISSAIKSSDVRREFPTVREQQTVVILDTASVDRSVDQPVPFRLSTSYSGDMDETNGLELRQVWPAETWDLKHGIGYLKRGDLYSPQSRSILQLTGDNGKGIYILMRHFWNPYDYIDPGTRYSVLYLARCDTEHDLTKVLPFLQVDRRWHDKRNLYSSRLRDHIHIGRFQNTTKHASFRVDVSIEDTQVAHSRSGIELRVNVKPSFFGSSERSGMLSSLGQFILRYTGHAGVVLRNCLRHSGWLVIIIIGPAIRIVEWLWYRYKEHRDRYRYR